MCSLNPKYTRAGNKLKTIIIFHPFLGLHSMCVFACTIQKKKKHRAVFAITIMHSFLPKYDTYNKHRQNRHSIVHAFTCGIFMCNTRWCCKILGRRKPLVRQRTIAIQTGNRHIRQDYIIDRCSGNFDIMYIIQYMIKKMMKGVWRFMTDCGERCYASEWVELTGTAHVYSV